MSNDQIIRSTKPHEVTIPEGSNNARSIRNKVGQRDIEEEQDDKVTADKHYTDRTVHGESDGIADRYVEVEHAADDLVDRIALEQAESLESGRVKVDDTDTQADHRVSIETSEDTTHRVPIASDTHDDNWALLPQDARSDHRATLPSEGPVDHRAGLDADALSSSHASLDAQDSAPHQATLPGDQIDSHFRDQEGVASSEPVKIPSDSMQDNFATTPLMTHTESSPVKVDGHGITDPDSVIVESSPAPLGNVLVPQPESEEFDPIPEHEEVLLAVVEDMPSTAMSASVQAVSAQVTAHLVDKKAEEFRGRVVKLRDEVDQLNRRLDEFKK